MYSAGSFPQQATIYNFGTHADERSFAVMNKADPDAWADLLCCIRQDPCCPPDLMKSIEIAVNQGICYSYCPCTTSEFMAVNLRGRGRSPEAKDAWFTLPYKFLSGK